MRSPARSPDVRQRHRLPPRAAQGRPLSVVYETLTADGEPVTWGTSSGRVLAALHQRQRHPTRRSGSRMGARAPISVRTARARPSLSWPRRCAFSRVTSGFAMRFHPIMQTLARPPGRRLWRADRHAGAGSATAWSTSPACRTATATWSSSSTAATAPPSTPLSRIDVRKGQSVSQSDLIGAVGATGWSHRPAPALRVQVRAPTSTRCRSPVPPRPPSCRAKRARFDSMSCQPASSSPAPSAPAATRRPALRRRAASAPHERRRALRRPDVGHLARRGRRRAVPRSARRLSGIALIAHVPSRLRPFRELRDGAAGQRPDELHRAALAANALAPTAYAEWSTTGARRNRHAGCGDPRDRRPWPDGAPSARPARWLRLLHCAAAQRRAAGRTAAIDVVADLRSRDVAAGGQGARWCRCSIRASSGRRPGSAIISIGGISNLTVLPGQPPAASTAAPATP